MSDKLIGSFALHRDKIEGSCSMRMERENNTIRIIPDRSGQRSIDLPLDIVWSYILVDDNVKLIVTDIKAQANLSVCVGLSTLYFINTDLETITVLCCSGNLNICTEEIVTVAIHECHVTEIMATDRITGNNIRIAEYSYDGYDSTSDTD